MTTTINTCTRARRALAAILVSGGLLAGGLAVAPPASACAGGGCASYPKGPPNAAVNVLSSTDQFADGVMQTLFGGQAPLYPHNPG